MWTAGFPEPRTFSKRVARLLRDRLDDFDVVHDNQVLGYGMLDIARMGFPLITTIHHPITFDRRIDLETADLRKKLSLRRWYGFLRMQGKVARSVGKILTVSESSRRDIVSDFGVDPDRHPGDPAGRRRASSGRRPTPRVPGRIVAMASADAPMKGIATLLEAFAKLRTEREVELLLVTKPKPGGRTEQLIEELGIKRPRPLRQRHQRRRAGRGDGLGRARLRAVPLRGLLAADRGADGVRDPAGGQPRRRDPRGRRPRRRVRRPGHPGRRGRAASSRSRRCSTTPSDGRGWARPDGAGCWRSSAGTRWPRPPLRRTPRRSRTRPDRNNQRRGDRQC